MEFRVDDLIDLTREAGEAILKVYETDFDVEHKGDDSPLTQADLAAHKIIEKRLEELTPEIPMLSEESVPPSHTERRGWTRYWLVDPLDGTKEFINRNGEFTVNIALIENGQPTFGFVGVPVQNKIYVGNVASGSCQCHGADGVRTLSGRPMKDTNSVTVVASRSHGGERLEGYLEDLAGVFPGVVRTPVGSSLKLCILAEGEADLYPRLGLTSEWDIGAAHAVLAAAGGDVWNVNGKPILYNKEETFLNPEFIAVSDRDYAWCEKLPVVPEKG
ncbi:MAG: 3'(2'),5'-bisphosphate nucleotidase CysQ [Pseudomonadales bacterium]|jgi:3'(2'), 5'-bisphosphate nucleotidase|nr:3'(2'),5'-bisphosphate nucleotidase CysQ [Pseudomonadales bacterium]MDP6469852.1 3'(2'),5'-bisphosphate nucleotidase CysQ [Pseudomonadales bacterium]MDP6827546.1 3'(2'),5'-bisphosphate nucleotidase CysQ [Pseudomonadales bacterium]MDP6971322.1 3'(2'),5'-bisphosphate nucleotidase CysQ [Pseudomonadales bacterium]|tara:strand:- start:1107 stop:1928 length:822 start_codon:yes stop_codon:yes gene_type:complete